MTRFQFVADHQHTFEVKRMCQVLGLAKSSYYAWAGTAHGRARRAAQDAALAMRIRALQDPVTCSHVASPRTPQPPALR